MGEAAFVFGLAPVSAGVLKGPRTDSVVDVVALDVDDVGDDVTDGVTVSSVEAAAAVDDGSVETGVLLLFELVDGVDVGPVLFNCATTDEY